MHLRYNVAQSLDGFIAPPDESTDWIVSDASIDFDALYESFDYFVMGRKTWDIISSSTPSPWLGRRPGSIVVISRTLREQDLPGVVIVREGYIEYIRRLKREEGKGIWLMGGGWLAGACLEARMLDGLDIAIMPVLLREGTSLVNQGKSHRLELSGVEVLESGILMTRYGVRYIN